MNDEKQKSLIGWICIGLGGLFVVAGLVIFFLSNQINFQTNKTEATVMGRYELTTVEGEKHTMLELSYRVGEEVLYSSYDYPGVLDEEDVDIDIYYDIKEPGMIVEAGWSFEALLVVALGLLLFIPGLFLKGYLNKFIYIKSAEVPDGSNRVKKELYDAKNQVYEGILPMLAGILFTVFGIVMLCLGNGWWCWIFIVVGLIELIYIGMEFIPALITCCKLSKVNQVKVKVYETEVDIAEEEKKEK